MGRMLRRYPIIAILLVLLACVQFEYYGDGWELHFPGFAAGIFFLSIICLVVMFKIFNAAHEACLRKGLIKERLRFRYDVLIPVATIAAMVGYSSVSDREVKHYGGEYVRQWEFHWGSTHTSAGLWFIGAIIIFALLYRILVLVRAVAASSSSEA